MKILVDMNLSPAWVDFLVAAKIEAVHWSQIGAADARDHDLMQWAALHGHVVLTCDLDFASILAATRDSKPSVLQLRSDIPSPDAVGSSVVAAIRQTERELTEGAIVSIDAARARLRVLPLRK